MTSVEQGRFRKLADSSAFYRSLYAEIEEIGWENLLRMGGDLTYLSFRILDSKGRAHFLEIQLNKNYPKVPPSVSTDVPRMFSLKWFTNSRLKNVINQFEEHVERLQEFWSILDEIDNSLCVVDPKQPSRSVPFRHISLGNDCFIMISININDPKSFPDCRFLGSDTLVNCLWMRWRRNSKRWTKDKTFLENVRDLLEIELPRHPHIQEDDRRVECGICYAQFLPIDDELGARGSGTDYTCDNPSCSRAFHSVCLAEWLRTITTTRQSFDVLFGKCPYCSEPIAIKTHLLRK